MRGRDLAVTVWLDSNYNMPSAIFLDAQCIPVFLNWLQLDRTRIQKFAEQKWNIVVFKEQFSRIYPWRENKKLWESSRKIGIHLDETSNRDADRLFIDEALRTYFHGQVLYQSQAEFLTLVRKRTRGVRAVVLSQHLAFRRIPEVDTFFVPDQAMDGAVDLPAQFDFYLDMKLHKQLKSVIDNQLANGHYPDAVVEACKLLFTYIRQIDATLTTDGGTLADQALNFEVKKDQPNKGQILRRAKIELNNYVTTSEIGEQQGYYRFVAGISDAFRNLNAHHSATDPFIISRFGDKHKALKVICFISLILEKLDERVLP